jgi:NAD+ synthase (glutamine-hydrolysing)
MQDRAKAEIFLSGLNHGFLRVAVILPRVRLADPTGNALEHIEQLNAAHEAGAQYALCPELGLTGYSSGDLFLSQTLLHEAEQALEDLLKWSHGKKMLVTVGMPVECDDVVFNCAVTIYEGQLLAVTPKTYLPNYGEFYEKRHFADPSHLISTEIHLAGRDAPIGTDILIDSVNTRNFVLAVDVCEDIWAAVPPSRIAALHGATVLANASASNITIGKHAYRQQLVRSNSAAGLAVQLYSAAGFGESTADLAWDGAGIIAERGIILAEAERFDLNGSCIVHDVNLDLVVQERKRITSWRDCRREFRRTFRRVRFKGKLGHGPNMLTLMRNIDRHPFVPSDPAQRDERCNETFLIQATSLARRLVHIRADRDEGPDIVVGGSGGQDSSHAINVALYALDLLNKQEPGKWPRSKLIIITMPGFGTTKRTKNNAIEHARATGATLIECEITELARLLFAMVDHDENVEDLCFENTQAWGRYFTELVHSVKNGAIVLGTGDLSELNLGWCTMFGDHCSHYNVNGGVPKTLISYLIRWTADTIFADDEATRLVLYDILDTPISPELKRPDASGKIAQKTEDRLGPYEVHDFYGYWMIRFGLGPSTIMRLAMHAFDGKYTAEQLHDWLNRFVHRFFANQFKRDVFMNGPKVGLVAVSPRGDWRMPSDACVDAWKRELDTIPVKALMAA